MRDLAAASLSFFPSGKRELISMDVGFRFGARGTHSSRTMMFEEIELVFSATSKQATRANYATVIIEENCLAKPTAATRRLSNQRLSELYGLDLLIAVEN